MLRDVGTSSPPFSRAWISVYRTMPALHGAAERQGPRDGELAAVHAQRSQCDSGLDPYQACHGHAGPRKSDLVAAHHAAE
jgi:hypothetical protein